MAIDYSRVNDKLSQSFSATNNDASNKLFNDAVSGMRPALSTRNGVGDLTDQLIMSHNVYGVASEDLSTGLIQNATNWAPTLSQSGLEQQASGVNPRTGMAEDPNLAVSAQLALDMQKYGLFTSNSPAGAADEMKKLDAANAAQEFVKNITPDRFVQIAGDDGKLSTTTIKALLDGNDLSTGERQALGDVLRNMDSLTAKDIWGAGDAPFSDDYVTLNKMGSKLNDYAPEINAINQLNDDTSARVNPGQNGDTPPANCDSSTNNPSANNGSTTTSTKPADSTNNNNNNNDASSPGTNGASTNADSSCPSPQTIPLGSVFARKGDGFDLIARRVYESRFHHKPSAQDEYLLSNYIASLNINNRQYTGGILHPKERIKVPDLSQFTQDNWKQGLQDAAPEI